MESKKKYFLTELSIVLLFIVLAYIYIAIPLHKGIIYVGSDRMFHIERLEEAYQTLKSGHIVSLISTYSSSRVGQAINTFYPWINLIPYSIIRLFVVKPVSAYYLFMMAEQFLGLIVAYFCVLKLAKNRKASILFSMLYRFSTYMLINDFARADIGEAWATIFLPMCFVGSYMIFTSNAKRKYVEGALLLALGLIFITYCHILTTVMVIGILSLIYIVTFYFQTNKLEKFIYFSISAGIYLLGSLIIIFPLIDTMGKVKIMIPNAEYFENYNLTFNTVFNKSLENKLDANAPHIGIVILVVMILGLFFFKKSNLCQKIVYILGVGILFMSTSLFPWTGFVNTPISVIQFPWRMLTISILCVSFYFVSQYDIQQLNKFIFVVIGAIIMVGVVSSEMNFILSQKNNIYASNEIDYADPWGKLLGNVGYMHVLSKDYDYLPSAAYKDYLPEQSREIEDEVFHHYVYINGKKQIVPNRDIKSCYQGLEYHIILQSRNNKIVLPFLIYNKNNYDVYINGLKLNTIVTQNSRLVVNYEQSGNVTIKVKYRIPLSYTIMSILSVITICGAISLYYVQYFGVKKYSKEI